MPDELTGCIDGCLSQLWRHSIASIWPRLGIAGKIAPLRLIMPVKNAKYASQWRQTWRSVRPWAFRSLPFLKHVAQFVVA